MAANRLLAWASEVGAGSWENWRTAARHLELEPSRMARNLSALGHVEFDWVSNRFAVAPPTLSYLRGAGGAFLISGARPKDFLASLEPHVEEAGAALHPPVPQGEGPDTLLIQADLEEAAHLADEAGCALVQDAAFHVAKRLPRLAFHEIAERAEPDERFPRRRLDPTWGFQRPPSKGDRPRGARNAVWWVEERRRETAYVVDAEKVWWRVPIREYAPFLAHPGITSFEYDSVARDLRILASMPLPPLQARAATLATGLLPRPDDVFGQGAAGRRALTYRNVGTELKELILRSLDATAVSFRGQL